MYKNILVALENSDFDRILIPHVAQLARLLHSHITLVHVADGWVARHYEDLKLRDSQEMIEDRHYLEDISQKLLQQDLSVSAYLALGDPPREILKIARQASCDLIAMTSHGHKFVADLFYGSTIEEVRHEANIPLLIVPGKKI